MNNTYEGEDYVERVMLARNAKVATIATTAEGVRGGEVSAMGSSMMLTDDDGAWAFLGPLRPRTGLDPKRSWGLPDLCAKIQTCLGDRWVPSLHLLVRVGLLQSSPICPVLRGRRPRGMRDYWCWGRWTGATQIRCPLRLV